MKHFYLLLTLYTISLIAVCSLVFYFLLIRPSVGHLAGKLDQTTKDLSGLKDQVAQIKLTVDRLEVRTTTFNDRVRGIQSTLDTTVGSDSAQIDRLTAVNLQIDQKLTELNNAPTPPTDMALGFVKIGSPAWKAVDVYASANVSSLSVGQLKNTTVYPYLQKQSGWYEVRIGIAATGWVPATYVTETNGL